MLATARTLMLERGNEDFTLQEVSSRGKVSIGSIYLRFENKDSLVRAVLYQATQTLAEQEDAMLAELAASCATLQEFVPRYVEAYAEVLRHNAPLLRLTMMRAEHDPPISRWASARPTTQRPRPWPPSWPIAAISPCPTRKSAPRPRTISSSPLSPAN
jgi:AcrR family transcriptional regulator